MTREERLFNITLDMNANRPVQCVNCEKEKRLIDAHLDGWAYRKNSFICRRCYKEVHNAKKESGRG